MSQIIQKFIGNDQVDDRNERLRNNQFLRARNAADSANINMWKVNASDKTEAGVAVNMGGFGITNMADPSSAQDAATKNYVDSVAGGGGQVAKRAARVVSVSNLALTGGASLSVDSVSLANGDRVLLVGQTAPEENGIYDVSGIGTAYSLTRSSDMDSDAEAFQGSIIDVIEGTLYGDSLWALDTLEPVTLDTDPLSFKRKSALSKKETFTLSGTDITNQYLDLSFVAKKDSIHFMVKGAGAILEGASFDYSVSYTGGSGGVTRITFLNDLATGGASALVASDVVQLQYRY